MEFGLSAVLGINTVFLYIFGFILIAFVGFLFIRTHIKKHKLLLKGGTTEFEGMTRADKQAELKWLQGRFVFLQDMFTWLDSRLMENLKAFSVRVTLAQEFYNEDHSGSAELPVHIRLKELIVDADETVTRYPISDPEAENLTADQMKLLCWGVMERCRTLIPFRVYRTKAHRSTRTFRVENNVPVQWKTDTVTKEDYTVEIK